MENIKLTVFTPTYNRQKLLKNLYKSLCMQSDLNFKWLIVDDGSTDETKDMVERWKEISPFEIRYFYQENGGKHVARNRAVGECDTEVFFTVDSDDILTSDAVKIILGVHEKYQTKDVLGYYFRKIDRGGAYIWRNISV